MKHILAFLLGSVLAASCATAVPVVPAAKVVTPGSLPFTDAQLGEFKGEQQGMCPDGMISLKLYDPDPKDEQAAIYVFVRGSITVAIREIRTGVDHVYVVAEGKWYELDEIKLKYTSPCDIPFVGR